MSRKFFSGINKRKQGMGNGTGKYLQGGQQVLLINKVIAKVSDVKGKGPFFIVELTVLEALLQPDVVKEAERYVRGEKITFMRDFQRGDDTLDDVNGFICGVAGCEPEDVSEELSDKIIGEGQPFAGMVVRVDAVTKPQKANPSRSWTTPEWITMDADEQKQAKKKYAAWLAEQVA